MALALTHRSYHGAIQANVQPGSTVYIAGAGPVGLAAAASCHLLGAAVVVVGDLNRERLAQARSFGCETVDIAGDPVPDQLHALLGEPLVDCAIDCVGFEARGCGHDHRHERAADVLNCMQSVTRAGGSVGVPGLSVTDDPGATDAAARAGSLSLRIGLGWAKSLSIHTGQCPVMKYHRNLARAILHDKIQIAKACNVQVIGLDAAPQAYQDFDKVSFERLVQNYADA